MARLPRVLATLALLIIAAALTASSALARDHDRLPDRWERKHHLNLKKNDARRDRDRDGLSNVREYRAHTNPRKKDSDRDRLRDGAEIRFGFKPRDRDSDNDGIKDGRENAGKVKTLSGSSITIKLAAGGKLTARLGDELSVSCKPTGDDETSGDAPDDSNPGEDAGDPGEDTGVDPFEDAVDPEADGSADDLEASAAQDLDDPESSADDDEALDEAAFDRQFENEFAEGDDACGTSSLKKGALVHEATIDRTGSGPVLVAVKLVRR